MRVLLIGGTGNISREIVRALLAANHDVTVVSRGQRPVPDDVQHVAVDRRDRDAFEAAMRQQSPEVVIDMIAFHPDDTRSALRAFEGRVEHFIQTSTVMTYGPPVERFWADETTALNAQGDYGRNKNAIDHLLLERHARADLPVTIIKPGYTYGPGIPLHRQIGDDGRWIGRLKAGLPFLSAGDGNTVFQFLPSRDAGAFYAAVVGRQDTFGQVFNMVHPKATTWDDWHRMAMQAVGRDCEIVHIPTDTLLAVDAKRYDVLPSNFAHAQLFSGEKAYRQFPDWNPTATDRVAWMAENIAWMEHEGLVVEPGQDDDDLEDRLTAAQRGIAATIGAA